MEWRTHVSMLRSNLVPLPPFVLVWASKRATDCQWAAAVCREIRNAILCFITDNMGKQGDWNFTNDFRKFSLTCNFCWMWGQFISVRGEQIQGNISVTSHHLSHSVWLVTLWGSMFRVYIGVCGAVICGRGLFGSIFNKLLTVKHIHLKSSWCILGFIVFQIHLLGFRLEWRTNRKDCWNVSSRFSILCWSIIVCLQAPTHTDLMLLM